MEDLKQMYEQGQTLKQVASQVGRSETFVKKRLLDADVVLRPSGFQKGSMNVKWIGGRRQDQNGYWKIYKPEHPMSDNVGYVFEHRLIMSEHLGRILTQKETVHHINGISDDNRIENLKLYSGNSDHLREHFKKRREQSIKINRILELYKNGFGCREIGRQLNICSGVANYHVKQAGLARTLKEAQQLRRKRERK